MKRQVNRCSGAAWLIAVAAVAGACAPGAGGTGTEGPAPEPSKRVAADSARPDTVAADSMAPSDTVPERPPADSAQRPAPADAPADTLAGAVYGIAPDSMAVPAAADLPVPILPGALLPQQRIVAFYGNPRSQRMGILGEVPPDEMLARLEEEVTAWREADPATPVVPALHMIAVMATGDPGRDSVYNLRMPDSRIEQVSGWAARAGAILFLDIQPGQSSVEAELPSFRNWLARPDVHLALDPEWAMPDSVVPGRQIGSMTAGDINHAIDFLAEIVEEYHLPPKVLVVHRFTQSMIRNAGDIRRDPRVQVVINMDGWGFPNQKRVAYSDIVAPEADQYTGFKLFFHNDTRDGSVLLTPEEILELDPPPIYIQYQ